MQAKSFLLLSMALGGCSPITPNVLILQKLPRGIDSPIYVTAARQKEEIVNAMRNAGFNVVNHMEDSLNLMRVTIGVNQESRQCGTLNNVRYQLRFEGETVVEAQAKGWTGLCQPNIFDVVSREIRRRLVETNAK